ncbi:MAG: Gfo/Idh/MocA family oxidoreductase [Candidatus Binatia bacterium]|nr:Gfo/Idh/MocA family oxidoreductase [Candidatus Binatia bacterium]
MDEQSTKAALRIGILGAARIAPVSLVRPAREVAGAEACGVAARTPARAGEFQVKHGLPRAFPSYDAMLSSDEIDAVYNPLPNGLHCEWTIRALEAGKHVLCEKPFASNADEAERMAAAATAADRRLMEAFHYRYHPLAARMREITNSGELGEIRHIETHVCFPLPFFKDIRYDYALGGGALMDAGCYAVHMLRFLAGDQPEVTAARPTLHTPDIDRAMEAEVRFPDGRSGLIRCSLFSSRIVAVRAIVRGDKGELSVLNPILPHLFHRLRVKTAAGTRRERVYGDASYTHQLRAFVDFVQNGTEVPTNAADAIANMRVIDAIYERAGMKRRGT